MTQPTFWGLMSDSWDSFEQRELFDDLWTSWSYCYYGAKIGLYQSDLGKSIRDIFAGTKHSWLSYNMNDDTLLSSGTYSLEDENVLSIPVLTDGVLESTVQYMEGSDYNIENDTIIWITTPPEGELWAPSVWKDEKRIYNNFGYLVQEEMPDSQAYINAISGMMYSYWSGPSTVNIRNGANLFFGHSFIGRPGIVNHVDSTSVEISVGNFEYDIYDVRETDNVRLLIGDSVEPYDSILDVVEVVDYVNSPKWWERFNIDMINPQFDNSELTDEAKQIINEYSKYFTFGVKVDGDKYSVSESLNAGAFTRFINKIKAAYTHYIFIVYNDFTSTAPGNGDGDWIEFIDGTADTPSGLGIEIEMKLYDTISFNYVNYLMYNDYSTNNMSYADYHTELNSSYDLDSDVIEFYEDLYIIKEV